MDSTCSTTLVIASDVRIKQCGRCKQWLPATSLFFYMQKPLRGQFKDGLDRICKGCSRVQSREYQRRKHPTRKHRLEAWRKGEKVCLMCSRTLPHTESNFRRLKAGYLDTYCRECRRSDARNRNRRHRESCLDHYGWECANCGHDDPDVLTIDHVENDGNVHRKVMGGQTSSSALYRWLIKYNFPGGFQTLCRNCNWKKYVNGGVLPPRP